MRSAVVLGALVLSGAACGRIGFDDGHAALAITPASLRTNPSAATTFRATGGEPPYVFTLAAGTGELDATSGVFRAPMYAGAATVEVTDAAGDVATAEVSFGGDYLYAAGGFVNDVPRDEVWRTGDGATWEVIGRLPAPRGGGSLLVLDDRLFYAGGADDPEGTSFDEVWSSPDGITWTEAGRLPSRSYAAAAATYRGRMWLVGGRIPSDNFMPLIWSSMDGASWQVEPPLAVGLHGGELAILDGAMWLVAGHESDGGTAAVHRRLDDGTWAQIGSVPLPGEYHAVTVVADELWVAGGQGLGDRVVTTTDATTWADHARLPIPRRSLQLVEWHDELWAVGGSPAQTLRAIAGEPWTVVGTFPALVDGGTMVQFTPVP